MKTKREYFIVLVTAPSLRTARRLASNLVDERLAACVNLVPGVESHYWWQGSLEQGKEVLLLIKTVRARLKALERFVASHHPYDTPEFLVLPIETGSTKYLRWLSDSTRGE